jgi:hypothetical protein
VIITCPAGMSVLLVCRQPGGSGKGVLNGIGRHDETRTRDLYHVKVAL